MKYSRKGTRLQRKIGILIRRTQGAVPSQVLCAEMRRFRHAPVEIPPAWARGRNETACRRIGVSAYGRNETAGRRAWRDRGRDDDSGRPSLRTGQANFWHPALQLVVTSKKIGKPLHAPVLRRTSQPW